MGVDLHDAVEPRNEGPDGGLLYALLAAALYFPYAAARARDGSCVTSPSCKPGTRSKFSTG